MWSDETSIEYIAAEELCKRLLPSMMARQRVHSDDIHLLVGGVEVSLWVAEQWAADLRAIFPYLNVLVTSANKLLCLDEHSPESLFFSGSKVVPFKNITSNTCALLISQSGQTFPTLHATRKLAKVLGNRLWILTGCFQSKMELAIIESYQVRGEVYGKNRVMNNYSGNRPAEPSSVAAAAVHHTLTHLLLHLVDMSCGMSGENTRTAANVDPKTPLSCKDTALTTLTVGCQLDLKAMLTEAVVPGLEQIVGYDKNHEPLREGADAVHRELLRRGAKWAAHVEEQWQILVLVGTYIILSVGLGLPIFGLLSDAVLLILRAVGALGDDGRLSFAPRETHIMYQQPVVYTLIGLLVQLADALFFVFLAKIFTWASRWLNGRPMWARHGKRTLVIVDTPMVHQLTEIFVSKLFSQSYGFVSLDVHGASGLDHFVHRFTHRVARGLLLAVGRPDGRLSCLGTRYSNSITISTLLYHFLCEAKAECATILAAKQAAFITNPDYSGSGSGPEIITVGHNSYVPNLGLSHNITLPCTSRGMFIDEVIFEYLSDKPKANSLIGPLLFRLTEHLPLGAGSKHLKLYGVHLAKQLLAQIAPSSVASGPLLC